jgi:hypothetical protein
MTGEKAGDEFSEVSAVGDVNGDGFDDVLVWARSGNYGKLYLGGAQIDTIAHIRFSGGGGGVGDVNGDGYNDIFIAHALSTNKKMIYFYFGGLKMDTIPDFEFSGMIGTENFGSITGIGDVNRDGFTDFMIGSYYNWVDGKGRAYLFFGGDTLKKEPSKIFLSDQSEDFFGATGCGCDLNGDGYNDVVIGALNASIITDTDTIHNIGEVYIFFGGKEMDNIADIKFLGTVEGEEFGHKISFLGDVNGDGYDDVLIGGRGKINKVYLLLGDADISKIKKQYEFKGNGSFGYTFSGLGDINKDSLDDFIIYAGLISSVGDPPKIGLNIYYGSVKIDTIPDFVYQDEYGYCSYLSGSGDMNGDGYREILVGDVPYSNFKGRIRIFSTRMLNSVSKPGTEFKVNHFTLFQSFPNPFNENTTILYYLSSPCGTNMTVFNCLGEKIITLFSGNQDKGHHRVIWNGKDENGQTVYSGIYFVSLSITNLEKTKNITYKAQKVMLIK